MQTQTISIDFPADILLSLNESENEILQDIRLSLAVRLFRLQKLTLGKAAQLANLSHFDFETLLSESGVPISLLTFDDVLNDAGKLK